MHLLTLIAGLAFLGEVLGDAFQTIILPRRASNRLRISRVFLGATWRPWRTLAGRMADGKQRENFLSYFGPLTLLLLIVIWAAGLILGFGLIFHAMGSPFADSHAFGLWKTDFYVSATTLFTLGLGDVIPVNVTGRLLISLESGMGLAFVAGVIAYLPVLYGGFSRRETSIILLDSRAGSPPAAMELLRRHAGPAGERALELILVEWERWSAELLETHISYPQLCFFRSQHDNQSWLGALVVMLDTTAILLATVQGDAARQAKQTFIMARHAIIDLAHVFSLEVDPVPLNLQPAPMDRFPPAAVELACQQLQHSGYCLCDQRGAVDRLRELRGMYEPYAFALSRLVMQPLPPFTPRPAGSNNWNRVTAASAQGGVDATSAPVSTIAADTLYDPFAGDGHNF
jgi:hypothetical protein